MRVWNSRTGTFLRRCAQPALRAACCVLRVVMLSHLSTNVSVLWPDRQGPCHGHACEWDTNGRGLCSAGRWSDRRTSANDESCSVKTRQQSHARLGGVHVQMCMSG
jgi:hypothetical protein